MLLYQTTLVSPQQQRELIVFGSFSYLLVDFSSSLYKAVALRLCRSTEGIGRLLFSIVYHRGIRPTVSTTEEGTYCLRQFFIPTSGFLQFSLLFTLGVLALRSPQQQVNPCLQLISLLVDYHPVPVLVCCCPCLDTFLTSNNSLQFY